MRKIAQFGSVKVYHDGEWGQYIAAPSNDEATWYYTDDKEDALHTAQTIANKGE